MCSLAEVVPAGQARQLCSAEHLGDDPAQFAPGKRGVAPRVEPMFGVVRLVPSGRHMGGPVIFHGLDTLVPDAIDRIFLWSLWLEGQIVRDQSQGVVVETAAGSQSPVRGDFRFGLIWPETIILWPDSHHRWKRKRLHFKRSGSSADGRDEAQGLRPEFVHGRQCAPCPDHRMSFRHARGHQRPT